MIYRLALVVILCLQITYLHIQSLQPCSVFLQQQRSSSCHGALSTVVLCFASCCITPFPVAFSCNPVYAHGESIFDRQISLNLTYDWRANLSGYLLPYSKKPSEYSAIVSLVSRNSLSSILVFVGFKCTLLNFTEKFMEGVVKYDVKDYLKKQKKNNTTIATHCLSSGPPWSTSILLQSSFRPQHSTDTAPIKNHQ